MLLRMSERTRLANLDRVLLSYRFRASSITGAAMTESRLRVAYACELARRRQSGAAVIGYEEFLAARRAAPPWQRAMESMEISRPLPVSDGRDRPARVAPAARIPQAGLGGPVRAVAGPNTDPAGRSPLANGSMTSGKQSWKSNEQ